MIDPNKRPDKDPNAPTPPEIHPPEPADPTSPITPRA
jgi:hypothetical protein